MYQLLRDLFKYNINKMEKIIKYFLFSVLMVVTTSEAFFLQSKDLRRMLKLFPKAFETETAPKVRPHRYRQREEPNYYRDDYTYDNYDRRDTGDSPRNTVRPSRGRVNGKYVYVYDKKPSYLHSHENCNHPDHYQQHHHHHKYPEDRVEKHQHNKKNKYKDSEEVIDSYDQKQKNYQNNKKKISSDEDEKESEDDVSHNKNVNANYKKDYISGVLVTIPKIKTEDGLENYYKDNKQQNVFFQQLLKTEDDDYHHHHHHTPEDDIKYLY